MFASSEIGDGVGFEAASLTGQNGIDETGKQLARNPETAAGYKRQSADELVASFHVSKQALHAEAQKRIAVGLVVLIADDDQAGFGETFHQIGEQRAGSRLGGVGVHNVDLSFRRLEVAEVGSESGLELLEDDFELRLGQKAFELAQHQRVGRENADS